MCQRLTYDQEDLEKELDKFGEQGWELTTSSELRSITSHTPNVTVFVFKRPKGATPHDAFAGCDTGM